MKSLGKKKKALRPARPANTHTVPWKQRLGSASFLAPSLIGVLVFFILPFMVVIYYSLVDNPISGNGRNKTER